MAAGKEGVFLNPIDFPRSFVMSTEDDKLSEKLCLLLKSTVRKQLKNEMAAKQIPDKDKFQKYLANLDYILSAEQTYFVTA